MTLGQVATITSYASADGSGTPVNQVEDAYDGWGNLTQEWQAVSGPVQKTCDPPTPSVQWIYGSPRTSGETGEGPQAVMYVRQTDVIYPSCRDLRFVDGYVTSPTVAHPVDNIMSRLALITECNGKVDAAYKYLGAGTVASQFSDLGNVNSYRPTTRSDSIIPQTILPPSTVWAACGTKSGRPTAGVAAGSASWEFSTAMLTPATRPATSSPRKTSRPMRRTSASMSFMITTRSTS